MNSTSTKAERQGLADVIRQRAARLPEREWNPDLHGPWEGVMRDGPAARVRAAFRLANVDDPLTPDEQEAWDEACAAVGL